MWDGFDATFFSVRAVLGPVFTVAFRPRTLGAENLPRSGPAILAANHASFLDPILIGMRARRPVRFLVSQEFYVNPRLNTVLNWFGAIPVGGPTGMIRSFRRIAEVIRRGELIGIFPEGAITRDGTMRPFRDGTAAIALRLGVPVVPIHVGGTFDALPRHARWPRFVPITLSIGMPIEVSVRTAPSSEEIASLTESIRSAIAALVPPSL